MSKFIQSSFVVGLVVLATALTGCPEPAASTTGAPSGTTSGAKPEKSGSTSSSGAGSTAASTGSGAGSTSASSGSGAGSATPGPSAAPSAEPKK